MKVLVVEDEEKLMESILNYLKEENYLCESVLSFKEALNRLSVFHYDIVLVDLNLPDGNGFNIVKEIRKKKSNTGIRIISARNSTDDKITGLDLGADDYLAKPFHLSELNARIKSLIRRISFDGSNIIELNEIKIDVNAQQVCVLQKEIILTLKEYQLLIYLISNKNRVITKNSIAEHVWKDEFSYGSYDFIYTHMKNLRKKMLTAGCEDYIKTIYGIGYKFEV
jgi:DNA-binding response OmpR family regulator